ncbi:D-aminoacyl-tRNA deacylase [Aquipuribacter nitratireducens]|uniref:D-aminoacyl-tRNA deacylase n=1 Tax=Aquipuribacter nitratireducens TaxID=650104 RepID=A0ABW0GM83_9MICO
MRAVVQRVLTAAVDVVDPDGTRSLVGELRSPGLLVLVGVAPDDGPEQVRWLADKLVGLRIMREERSVLDAVPEGAGVLLVSQFTLYGDVRRGRRPTWAAAAPPQVAEPLVDALAAAVRERGVPVATGRFRADMRVRSENDGPVTLVVDTP